MLPSLTDNSGQNVTHDQGQLVSLDTSLIETHTHTHICTHCPGYKARSHNTTILIQPQLPQCWISISLQGRAGHRSTAFSFFLTKKKKNKDCENNKNPNNISSCTQMVCRNNIPSKDSHGFTLNIAVPLSSSSSVLLGAESHCPNFCHVDWG